MTALIIDDEKKARQVLHIFFGKLDLVYFLIFAIKNVNLFCSEKN